MSDLQRKFTEREQEISLYLSFLDSVQNLIAQGSSVISGPTNFLMTPKHQKVLHASVFLHLYNLVESTITWSIELIETTASDGDGQRVHHLSAQLRKEWVRTVARTSEDLSPDNRLASAMMLCGYLVNMLPPDVKIARGGGGNWDDDQITDLAKRIGMPLSISQPVYARVKRPIRNDMGPLKLIKKMRNELAHGSISFAECGADHSVSELRGIADVCLEYLKEIISCVEGYVARFEYLDPVSRPHLGAAV